MIDETSLVATLCIASYILNSILIQCIKGPQISYIYCYVLSVDVLGYCINLDVSWHDTKYFPNNFNQAHGLADSK